MQDTRPGLGQRLRNNWLELLLLLLFVAAIVWIAATARGVWQTVAAVPTEMPTAIPTASPAATQAAAVAATQQPQRDTFDGQRAASLAVDLVAAGPRAVELDGHAEAVGQLIDQLQQEAWELQQQSFTVDDLQHTNIIARGGSGDIIVVAAHYDTAPVSDLDPDAGNQATPSPGANDGASGAAVLLELARSLNKDKLNGQVWLAFLDGKYAPLAAGSGNVSQAADSGASALAQALPDNVKAVILVDLAGDPDQRFTILPNGDPQIAADLWAVAEQLGYARWFVTEIAETPDSSVQVFSDLAIPAAGIIDHDYTYLRTTGDTPDKLSSGSLERVGRVLEVYLEQQE